MQENRKSFESNEWLAVDIFILSVVFLLTTSFTVSTMFVWIANRKMFYILLLVGKLIRNIYFLYHLLSFLFFPCCFCYCCCHCDSNHRLWIHKLRCTLCSWIFFVFVTCFVCRKFAFVGFSSLFVEKWSRAQKNLFLLTNHGVWTLYFHIQLHTINLTVKKLEFYQNRSK